MKAHGDNETVGILVLHDITINIDINDVLIARYNFINTTILSSYYSRLN